MSLIWEVISLQAVCTVVLLAGIWLNYQRVISMRSDLVRHRLRLEQTLTQLESDVAGLRADHEALSITEKAMAARKENIQTLVWLDRRTHEDDPAILDGDWRDADHLQRLDGIRIQSNDLDWQESHSKSEPDWSLGFYGMDQQGRQVDLMEIFKKTCLEGRVLYGTVISRDEQRHGR